MTMYPELLPPSLPPRSRLISLPPCDTGTTRVESLTGYVARLAGVHGVGTGILLQHELARHLKTLVGGGRESGVSLTPAYLRSMNGLDPVAETWTRVLEELTCRDNLHFLTMLTWTDVLPSRGLFRDGRAWCPQCYAEDELVHEHLLWCLAPVVVCPHHQRPLETRCPHCREGLPVISWRSVPGFCSSCRGWLGTAPEGTGDDGANGAARNADASAWDHRVAENLGELLAIAPGLACRPGKERIARALKLLTGCTEAGRIAGKLGVDYMAAWVWSTGKMRPLLSRLLPICARFGVSLADFYTGETLAPGVPDGILPPMPEAPAVSAPARSRRGSRRKQHASLKRAGAYLQRVVAEQPTPAQTLHEICRKLGHDKPVLYRHYPDLCRVITARWKAWNRGQGADRRERLGREVREAALRLHAEGMVPTTLRVARLLASPGAIRDPVSRSTLREVKKQLGLV